APCRCRPSLSPEQRATPVSASSGEPPSPSPPTTIVKLPSTNLSREPLSVAHLRDSFQARTSSRCRRPFHRSASVSRFMHKDSNCEPSSVREASTTSDGAEFLRASTSIAVVRFRLKRSYSGAVHGRRTPQRHPLIPLLRFQANEHAANAPLQHEVRGLCLIHMRDIVNHLLSQKDIITNDSILDESTLVRRYKVGEKRGEKPIKDPRDELVSHIALADRSIVGPVARSGSLRDQNDK
ncbi:Unknown protein, partial [Striga hermonthica]